LRFASANLQAFFGFTKFFECFFTSDIIFGAISLWLNVLCFYIFRYWFGLFFFVILRCMNTISCSEGVVVGIARNLVRVRVIADGDSCAGCSVAALCGKGDVIEVPCRTAAELKTGTRVRVVFSGGSAPLWLMILMPLLILVGVATGLLWAGVDDLWCVTTAVGALALWYVIIHYIYKRVTVSVEPLAHSERSKECVTTDD